MCHKDPYRSSEETEVPHHMMFVVFVLQEKYVGCEIMSLHPDEIDE